MVEPQLPLLPKAGKFWEVFLGSDHSWGALAPCQSSQLRARPALSRLQAALGVLRRPTKAKEWAWMQGLKAECSLTAFRALGPVWPGGRRPRDGDTLPTLLTEPFPVLLPPPPRGGSPDPSVLKYPAQAGVLWADPRQRAHSLTRLEPALRCAWTHMGGLGLGLEAPHPAALGFGRRWEVGQVRGPGEVCWELLEAPLLDQHQQGCCLGGGGIPAHCSGQS